MGQRQTARQFLESLPEAAAAVRVRVGSGRSPSTVAVVASDTLSEKARGNLGQTAVTECDADELVSQVLTELDANGWPDEHPTARLHVIDVEGKQLKSWQQTATAPTGEDGGAFASVVRRLTDGLMESNAEIRRCLDVVTDSLAHRESVLAHALEATIEAKQAQVDAEGAALAARLEALAGEAEDPLRAAAAESLQAVAGVLMGGAQGGELTAENVVALLEARPELARELARDERVAGLVLGAIATGEDT